MYIELRDEEGRTPLLVAVDGLNAVTLDALLAHGANVHARSDNGWTALDWLADRIEKQRPTAVPDNPFLLYLLSWPASAAWAYCDGLKT